MVRLATQFTINFLYLDVWLRRYILPPFWVDFPSLLSLLESSVTYFSPTLGFFFFWSQSIGFLIRESASPVPKNPSVRAYLLPLCVRKCAAQVGKRVESVMCCRYAAVCQCRGVHVFLFLSTTSCFWPVSLVTLS